MVVQLASLAVLLLEVDSDELLFVTDAISSSGPVGEDENSALKRLGHGGRDGRVDSS